MNDQAWANTVVSHCLARGIDHFFVAPGSRCTPLTLAIAKHNFAQVTQHFDERGLAFATLGFGRSAGRPGVFVCTSGTAVANAFPAVIEAATEGVPMLLFTADRPDELRGTGANQTIEQREIFGSYPRLFLNMPAPEDVADTEESFLDNALAQCFAASAAGPVHVNWMFREPFTIDDGGDLPEVVAKSTSAGDRTDAPSLPVRVTGNTLVVLGNCKPEEAREAQRLASRLRCPLLTDITSGLRAGSLELPSQFELPEPNSILHLGGRVVSKSWLSWTKSLEDSGVSFIHLTSTGQNFNPNQVSQTRVHTPLVDLDTKVDGEMTSPAFLDAWQDASRQRQQSIRETMSKATELSEPAVAYHLFNECPVTDGLFIGNSMPIRDMDWYSVGQAEEAEDVRCVDANRGASGIDGLLATATGFAAGLRQSTTVVLGDLSALHDLSSFSLVANSPWPVTVVVINNQGGHIFDLLPISRSQHFEKYFATPHTYQFEPAAKMFGLAHHRISKIDDFLEAYRKAIAGKTSVVLELMTDRKVNLETRQQLKEEILKCSQS